MRIAPILGLILASVAIAQDAKQDSPASTLRKVQPFPTLSARVGGDWIAHWNPATNTPDSIIGTGIKLDDWRGNSLDEARRHALQLLREHADLLMLGDSEFRESIGARMGSDGNVWSFKFDQYFRGLPCIGGRADVRINIAGVVAKLGSRAWQIPATFVTVPIVDELEAQAKAWLALGQRQTDVPQSFGKRDNRLVIWGDVDATDTAPFYLAWEIPISNVDAQGRGPIGRYYIDARNGTVLHYTSDKHECAAAGCSDPHCTHVHGEPAATGAITPTTITVMAWTRNGQSAISALVNMPLVGLQVSVPGFGVQTTDSNGQFTIDLAAPVTITVTNLDGRHCGPITDTTGNTPNVSVPVTPGVPATIQLLNSAATQDQATHVGTFFWIDTVNEWSRSILGNSAQLNTADAVSPRVNVAGTCNAFYSGNTVNFYPLGGGCNNTGFSTVAMHEWGHGLDDRYGGISQTEGLSEGWGDIIGMYNVDNPVVGIDFTTSGGFVRTGLNTRLYGTATEVHAAGEVWMGFAWRLRDNLATALGNRPSAIAISNTIVVGSIVADATNQADAVEEVFIADDNDGNVFNGTPHYTQLAAAATTKGIPFPQLRPISITHAPLLNTSVRYTPRIVNALATPNDTGTVTQMTLAYSVNGGPVVNRPMVPSGVANGWRAMLPGAGSGAITYHINATSTTGTTRLPDTGEFSYSIVVIPSGTFTTFFSENFEGTAPGWTHVRVSGTATDDWQLGTPNGKSGTSLGVAWADPSAGVSSRVFGTDLGAGTSNGAYPASMNYYLRSPVINCSGRTGVALRFRRWLTCEESTFDHAQINVNGVLVWENPVGVHTIDTSWQQFEYTLPMADNNPSVQIEFRLISDGGLQLGGWNIDDVEVGTRPIQTVPGILQVVPEQAAGGAPCSVTLQTDEPLELFAIIYGDTTGPTLVSPFPIILVGGTMDFFVGVTDAAGLSTIPILAPAGMPPSGVVFYSQALIFESDNTYTTSNQNLTLFTQ
jgi:hypothetical protein